jgi:UDP-4-amino-4,6-dideoxy-N-acetyl-beta-L-altrosamine transaminase
VSNPTIFLPYGRQTVTDEDIAAVNRVLRSDFLTTGPEVAAFEGALAERVGADFAIAVSSGTAALHLAALALGLGPGDAVVVPSLTFVATANAARYVGADVVFADVDPNTGLMGPAQLEAALARAKPGTVRAVFPVHLNGQPCDMASLHDIASDHGLPIVEDACHALGGTIGEQAVGSGLFSAMTMFSFHPVKLLAMGEGGALTTNDAEIAAKLRNLRNHGLVTAPDRFVRDDAAFDEHGAAHPWYYEMHEPGFNYRASDIHCALGHSQLNRIDQTVARRAALAKLYDAALLDLDPVLQPVQQVGWGKSGWHLYPVLINFATAKLNRDELMRALREREIGTQVHYIPVHRQPYYANLYGESPLPGADHYYTHCLSLPLFPAMADGDVERVSDALHELMSD